MGLTSLIFISIWIMLPAYVPNNVAAIFGKNSTPLDLGNFFRGKRILGDGKTIKGTLSGILCGILMAFLLNFINNFSPLISSFNLPVFSLTVILLLPIGSMIGDALASFLKRSMGVPSGDPVFLLDQLDFVIGSLLLVFLISPIWFLSNLTLPILATIFILTPFLHAGINVLGYILGIKKVPW